MTSAEPIISVSGLRGIVGTSLTPDIAMRYVAAFCASMPAGPMVVTRDGRPTGMMLGDAIHSAVVASGRNSLNAGIAATPTTGVLVRQLQAAGGIQISASHNPAEYNGIKLLSEEGRVIPAVDGERVLAAYHQGQTAWVAHDQLGRVETVPDPISEHLRRVTGLVDLDRIRNCQFRVVLDANHGAGSVLGGPLLEALGCQSILLDTQPDGQFAHPPEPLADNLAGVARSGRAADAQVTFCQDPDADRLAIIDENGHYLGEEATLALCAQHILGSAETGHGPKEALPGRAIVTNCSTSRMTEDIANRYGAPFHGSAVGEANVVDAMRKHHAILGGEGNGGVIDPRVGWVRDSFVGMALVLDLMAATGQPISQLAAALPHYAIHKSKVALERDAVGHAFKALEAHFQNKTTTSRLDGLRFDWPDGTWLLVRPSNTEPIVRVIAEAATADRARQICDEACQILTWDQSTT